MLEIKKKEEANKSEKQVSGENDNSCDDIDNRLQPLTKGVGTLMRRRLKFGYLMP